MLTQLRIILLAALFTTAACGASTIGSGPCDGDTPADFCGQDCSGDAECAAGSHCAADNTCYAECTPTAGCADGYQCDDKGRCQYGQTPYEPECPRIVADVERVTPTVQILIDQSGSMTERFGGISRWRAVYDALVGSDQSVVPRLQNEVNFGATLYTSFGGYNGGQCPVLKNVDPRLSNYDDIRSLLANNSPQRDTPTAESIAAVAAAFPPPDPENPGPRIILLATDGNPDTCADPDAHNAASQALSEQAVGNAYGLGLRTFVLSVGNDVALPHLQRLANAGQGLNTQTGNARYYVANNPAELVTSFEEIIGIVRACSFTISGSVSNPNGGTVRLNGQPINYGTDWIMPTDRTLELVGDTCQAYLNDPNPDLFAEFDCDVIVL